jgi:hypothetical protein
VFGPPVYGWGPFVGPPFGPPLAVPPFFAPPPVVVVPPPVVFAANPEPGDPPPPAAVRQPGPVPLAKRGDFVVFRPNKDPLVRPPADEGVIVPKLDRVAPPPPPFKFDPLEKRDHAVKVDRPDPDPATESARQMKLARAAFAAEQYGAAADHLDAAAKARPDDALPHFLKAQVRFAAGRYAEAVAAVRDGMKLAPDWPAGTFRAKELYGPAEARFDQHLADLAGAAEANPDEPGLTFLLGYQFWFGGDRAAAAKLFRTAAGRVKDPALVDRFLSVADKPGVK